VVIPANYESSTVLSRCEACENTRKTRLYTERYLVDATEREECLREMGEGYRYHSSLREMCEGYKSSNDVSL
jgi:hypothetical protein